MKVEVVDDRSAEWDNFVTNDPEGTYCHLSGWRDVIGNALGHAAEYRVATDGAGTIQGVLPLIRVRHPLFGHHLISMPFLNHGGAIGSRAAREALVTHAVATARKNNVGQLQLRNRLPSSGGLETMDRKITVLLQLPETSDELLKSFRPNLRKNIRKSERNDLVLETGRIQVRPFYTVFAQNMRDLGTPVLPLGLFEQIADVFADIVVFAVIYAGEKPVAAQCAFVWGDELEMVWGSSLREYNRLKPTSMMHWAMMKYAIDRQKKVFDFGRCTEGTGTHQFKTQWGGVDVPLLWSEWNPAGKDVKAASERRLLQYGASVWRHFPLPLANSIGPRLARWLP